MKNTRDGHFHESSTKILLQQAKDQVNKIASIRVQFVAVMKTKKRGGGRQDEKCVIDRVQLLGGGGGLKEGSNKNDKHYGLLSVLGGWQI